MATLSAVSHSSLSLLTHRIGNKRRTNTPSNYVIFRVNSLNSRKNSLSLLKASLKDEHDSNSSPSPPSSTTSTVVPESGRDEHDFGVNEQLGKEDEVGNEQDSTEEKEKQQEMDWKNDEEFKKFKGNLSIEAAIKLERKRADRKLKDLDRDSTCNPISGLFNRLVRASVTRERERLEKAEETFKALDLNKLKRCFGFDTFLATDVRRFGDGGIFIGNLRRPIDVVIPKLEKRLSEAAGGDVVLWFIEEK